MLSKEEGVYREEHVRNMDFFFPKTRQKNQPKTKQNFLFTQ